VRRLTLSGSVVCGAALVVAACAGGNADTVRPARSGGDFVIVATGPEPQRRIGAYRHADSRQDYARAVQVFGKPSSWGLRWNLCVVRWRRLGLDLEFRVDGSCSPPKLRGLAGWCGATVHTARWRTKEGLRVGDSEARLRSLYPRAKFSDVPPNPPTWTLTPAGRLIAEAWGGAVTALRVFGTCV
jgi:hypothetical protein